MENRNHKRLVSILLVLILGMFGFSYLMVPIFNAVCKQLGINGKNVMAPADAVAKGLDESRIIKVEFTSTVHNNLRFRFQPLYKQIKIHPGERRLIYFYAENETGGNKIVQAVPSITPADAARYLKKIECFCFTQQYFYKGEKADMPVNFYIDPDIPKNIKEITLSYTLFDAGGFEKKNPNKTVGRIHV